jgi:hypothetical protein
MEELVTGAVEETAPAAQKWYEGVSLEDAEIYIQANLKSAARSVIAIGYYLKCVHRNELFKEAGYKDICEYAKDRFGFSASTTSRYMTRNDKFSVNGNSPILDDKYKDFNKSQLQEMLSLDAEQLEKVTPDMTVVQIREMKRPKEIPYIAIPGQIELTDLPGVEPEDVAAAAQARKEMVTGSPEKQAYTISAADLLPEAAEPVQPAIAISQQDSGTEVIHFTAGDRTIDGAYGATIAAVVRAYVDNGYERPEKECEVTAFGMGYKVLKGSDVTEFYTDAGQKVFDVENVRLEKEYQYWHRNRSQQEPETAGQQILPEKSGKCIYRPEFECTLEEAHKLTPGTGEDCSQACCWDCVRRGDCKLECYSSERRPEVAPEEHSGESAAEVQQEVEDAADVQQEGPGIPSQEECLLDFYQNHMSRQCVQAVKDGDAKVLRQELISNHGEPHDGGSTEYGFYQCGPEQIHFQDNMCETFLSLTWGRYAKELLLLLDNSEGIGSEAVSEPVENISEIQENVIDGEFAEIQNPEEPLTELQIAQDELERAKKLLKDGLGCGVDENDIHIRRLKTKVCALAGYVCDLDNIVNPPPKPEQPVLPVLKNNDQRAAFVDAYETWPLWIETKQTGERYYRYDLEDGTSMVVKVYHARIFDGYASGSYEAQYHDGYGRHEYYLLRDGKFFRDCETNRGLLIEKLKEIQKVKKG